MAKDLDQNQQTSLTMPETSINYKEFEENYSRELLLMDCIDWLKDRPLRRKGDPRPLGVLFQYRKTFEEFPQMDQVL